MNNARVPGSFPLSSSYTGQQTGFSQQMPWSGVQQPTAIRPPPIQQSFGGIQQPTAVRPPSVQQSFGGIQQQSFGGVQQPTVRPPSVQQSFGGIQQPTAIRPPSVQQSFGGIQQPTAIRPPPIQQSFGGIQQQSFGGIQQSFGGIQQQSFGGIQQPTAVRPPSVQQSFGGIQQPTAVRPPSVQQSFGGIQQPTAIRPPPIQQSFGGIQQQSSTIRPPSLSSYGQQTFSNPSGQPIQYMGQHYESGVGGFEEQPIILYPLKKEEKPKTVHVVRGFEDDLVGPAENIISREVIHPMEKRARFKLSKGRKPNPVSPERFDESMIKTITDIRRERFGGGDSRTCYLPSIRCMNTGCSKILSDSEIGYLQDIFFELIDPEGQYKLSTEEAFQELNIKKSCCKNEIMNPIISSWESYIFDRRYAEGLDLEKEILNETVSLSRVRNMKVMYRLDNDKLASLKPKIQETTKYQGLSEEEIKATVEENDKKLKREKYKEYRKGLGKDKPDLFKKQIISKVSIPDSESQLILAPGSTVVGYVELSADIKVPIVASLIKLNKTRQ